MSIRTLILLAGCAACVAGPGFAQTPNPDENLQLGKAAEQQVFKSNLSSSVSNGPNGGTLKTSNTPDFQFLASADDKIASVAWTLDLSAISPANTLAADQFTFTASSQLDSSGDAKILGLKGFTDGAEVKVAYTHFGATTHLTGKAPSAVLTAEAICRATPGPAANACDAEQYEEGGVSAFVAKYYPEGLRPLLEETMPGRIWFSGVEFAGNQANYDYLDRAAFTETSESHWGYSGTVFGGFLLNTGQSSIAASYTWGRAYRAQGEIMLCQPLSGTVQSQCLTARDGAPAKQDKSIVSLELRHAFGAPAGSFATVALAPELSFDLESDAYSVTLPLYLVGDGEGKLRGGVRGAYLSEKQTAGGRKDSFTLGVFVGVPFSALSH